MLYFHNQKKSQETYFYEKKSIGASANCGLITAPELAFEDQRDSTGEGPLFTTKVFFYTPFFLISL